MDVQSFLLQGFDTALLELQNVLPLRHPSLYARSTSESIGFQRRISSRLLVVSPCFGYNNARPAARLILRPFNHTYSFFNTACHSGQNIISLKFNLSFFFFFYSLTFSSFTLINLSFARVRFISIQLFNQSN